MMTRSAGGYWMPAFAGMTAQRLGAETTVHRACGCHHPRKRMIQYAAASMMTRSAGGYRMPAFAGMTAQMLGIEPLWPGDRLIEIIPIGIVLLNELDLPGAIPLLELLLPTNGFLDVFMDFVVDQAVNAVSFCEAGSDIRFVLVSSSYEIACHADVKPPILLARM